MLPVITVKTLTWLAVASAEKVNYEYFNSWALTRLPRNGNPAVQYPGAKGLSDGYRVLQINYLPVR